MDTLYLVTLGVLILGNFVQCSISFDAVGCVNRSQQTGLTELSEAEYDIFRGVSSYIGRRGPFLQAMAAEACQASCLRKHTTYFALTRNGMRAGKARCFCGNNFTNPVHATRCNFRCSSGRPCGGDQGHGSVYKVIEPSGCAAVATESLVNISRSEPVFSQCREKCLDSSMPMFGLRRVGGEDLCYCLAEDVIDFKNQNNNGCLETCDSVDLPCGGALNVTSIYRVCPSGRSIDPRHSNLCIRKCDSCATGCYLNNTCLRCPEGLQGQFCEEDVNECSYDTTHNCRGEATCTNTHGGFTCQCPRGYILDPSGPVQWCHDVDECTEETHNCVGNATCTNTLGSFECNCPRGYNIMMSGDAQACEDIDECQQNQTLCGLGGECNNTEGSYECICEEGFTSESPTDTCQDIDECRRNNSLCGDGGECYNTEGSYECRCGDGYTFSSNSCQDINECQLNQTICGDGLTCMNTDGSYECGCEVGYTLSSTTESCQDIDECQQNQTLCGLGGQCNNTEGSYECRCDDGYTSTSPTDACQDIDECRSNQTLCGDGGACNNTKGSYECRCHDGYNSSSLTASCQDINECLSSPCDHGTCYNTRGSFRCECYQGYQNSQTDARMCIDINECKDSTFCQNGRCANVPGSYRCDRCDSGYELSVDDKHCTDINECKDSTFCQNGRCANVPGSYRCDKCDSGYELSINNKNCTDVNECLSSPCYHGDCNNTDGSYRCACHQGYHNPKNDDRRCITAVHSPRNASVGSSTIAVAVSLSLIVLVLLAVLAFFLYKIFVVRRRQREFLKTNNEAGQAGPTTTTITSTLELNDVPAGTKIDITNNINHNVNIHIREDLRPGIAPKPSTRKQQSPKPSKIKITPSPDTVYGNVGAAPTNPVIRKRSIEDFLAHVQEQKTRDEPLKPEYESLPSGPTDSWDMASNPELKLKNKFKNILPYDKNRVVLQTVNGDPLSEYINASYLHGYTSTDKYIAGLGPRPQTVSDFWRLVWEQRCHLIVMLTNVVEAGVVKCEQYWPEGESQQFGDITVRLESMEPRLEHVVRKLRISKVGDDGWTVTQMHYTVWPDHGVPRYASSLLGFRRLLKQRMVADEHTIVHCSAGIGRTGTLVALDILLKQADAEGALDVYACVEELRHQRVGMVQTWQQYVFLHEALAEYFLMGDTCRPKYCVHELVATMEEMGDSNGLTKYEEQHCILERTCPLVDVYDTRDALNATNKPKNRDLSVLPLSEKLPFLKTAVENGNDYVNAVWVNGFLGSRGFIATQLPLENTVIDFWRLVLDYNVRQIVIVLARKDSMELPRFLPTESDPITVNEATFSFTSTNIDYDKSIISKTLTLTTRTEAASEDDESNDYMNAENIVASPQYRTSTIRITALPQPDDEPLLSAEGVISVYSDVKTNMDCNTTAGPVMVACMNGARYCGQYIACSNTFDMINTESELDIFQTVRRIKDCRPQFIKTKEEYQHMFTVASQYIGDYDLYSNL